MSQRLNLVEDFINTRSVEFDTDEVATKEQLAAWLRERGLMNGADAVTPAGLRRALRLREGLRALAVANSGERPDASAMADLRALSRELPLFVDVSSDPPQLRPRVTAAVDAALATLLAVVAESVADGAWARFKACREPNCQWAYVDESRNRSRAWCSMASCGNRAKARAFRDRSIH